MPRLRIDPEIQTWLALQRSGALRAIWSRPDAARSLDGLVQARLEALGREDLFDEDDSDTDASSTRIRGGNVSPEVREGKPGDLFNAIWAVPQGAGCPRPGTR